MTTRRTAALASALLVAVVTVTGCSSSGSSGDSSGGASSESGDVGSTASTAEDAKNAASADGTVQQRSVVTTARMTLVGDDLDEVRDGIDTLLGSHEGFVSDESSRNDAGGALAAATLTVRVPAASLDALVRDLRELATVRDAHRAAEDVTTKVIDVDARVASQRASIERLRSLLAQSGSVDALLRVESELAAREASLESLLAQQKYLADQTSLATLVLTLAHPGETPASKAGFVNGLRHGWDAFTASLQVLVTGLGAVLPFAVVLAAIGAIAWGVVSRRARRRSSAG